MLFSLLKHYLDTDTALKVSQSVYCFTTSISHGVENYFPRLWGTGISDAIFVNLSMSVKPESLLCITFSFMKYMSFFGIQCYHPKLLFNKSDKQTMN